MERWNGFWVRPWEPGDRDRVAALIGSVLAEFGLPWEPEGADRDVLAVEECYCDRGGEFWVVERDRGEGDRELVGTGGYYPVARGPRAVEIRKMYFLPTVRGQGLGRWLLTRLEGAIAQGGFGEIWIETAESMTAAQHLYERCGYVLATEAELETARCDRVYVKRIKGQA
ncbi:MAG: GNAT family N-acetyltransferase [Cyanobacteria bacterium]|nr:GNAT family N-acetyltransferase [Cyanobacteriota bacterium]